MLILDYYPKCALLHARLKKLYFFQIVKERKLHLSKTQALDKCSQNSNWWRMTGSNRRPPACKAGALPAELIPP
ncbi:hypothetical protein MASSI9I_60432 [Massilia sp. 9I]|nr:hypothetical protein MASSI9I_100005 [Massilia sp. 9I]VXC38053.1 hypothetical protein MASSI9I_60432 [Massilia sp. 9I]